MTTDYNWNLNDLFISRDEFIKEITLCYNLIDNFKGDFFSIRFNRRI